MRMEIKKKKKAEVATLIWDKYALNKKKIIRDKEEHCIMTNGLIKEEDITTTNIYSPNIGIPQYTRQTLTDINIT